MNVNREVVDKIIQIIPPILGDSPFGLLMDDDGPHDPICFDEIQEAILDIDGNAEIKYGVSSLCIGGGMGAALLLKKVNKDEFNER